MKKIRTYSFLLTVILLLAGCAGVVSEVTVFHNLPHNAEKNFGFYKIKQPSEVYRYSFAKMEHQQYSLEYEAYQKILSSHLSKNNFIEGADSDIVIVFDYGVNDGKSTLKSIPIFGQVGTTQSGYPLFGVTGSMPFSETNYTRWLQVKIFKISTDQVIYEAKVLSAGRASNIRLVIEEMLSALFKNFPGESGSVKIFEI